MWLETCSSVAHIGLGLQHWTLRGLWGLAVHPDILNFKKDMQWGLLKPETAAKQPHPLWKCGIQGKPLFSLATFPELLTLAIIVMLYLFWWYRHLTSTSWFSYVIPKYRNILHWIKKGLQNVLSINSLCVCVCTFPNVHLNILAFSYWLKFLLDLQASQVVGLWVFLLFSVLYQLTDLK